jgi:hypothetical protein
MATVSNRYLAVLGPIKAEILNLTATTDADTVTSQLQRPSFGFAVVTTDGGAMTAAVNLSISGRTVTLNSVDLSASAVTVVLFGF